MIPHLLYTSSRRSSRAITRLNQLNQLLTTLATSSPHLPTITISNTKRASSTMAPTPDITLYSMATPNGIKASIILEELGLQYKLVPIDISTNAQKEPWFLKINPNGRIPALTDGEQRVFESGAIVLYLTDKYDAERKFTFEHGTPEYVEMVSWIMFQMGGVGPMQGQANHFVFFAGVRSDYSQKRYLDETRRLFSVVEDRLRETGSYLAGNKYSIADIVNWSWIQAADSLDIDLEKEFPAVYKWVEEISQRPAVQKGKNIPPRKFSAEKFKEFVEQKKASIRAMENTDKHP